MTALDATFEAMQANPANDNARLSFYERLADAELFVLLDEEPQGTRLSPSVFDTSDGRFVLVFDREDRLTAFTDGPAPYAALSGRAVAKMLAGQEIGLGLNLGVAPSSFIIPAGALAWLSDTLAGGPESLIEKPEEIAPPSGLPETLVTGLDTRLASATGLAQMAYLVAVTYEGGRPGHMLAFIDAEPGAEDALAKAISETLVFSGIEAGTLDVAFFPATDPIAAKLARHGLRFDLPQIEATRPPGSDPTKPPKLR